MLTRYLCLAIGALLSVASATANAQVACNQRDKVVDTPHQGFHEVQVGAGLMPGGQLVEIFASPAGTWTILMSLPTGKSCLIAAGENWNGKTGASFVPGRPI